MKRYWVSFSIGLVLFSLVSVQNFPSQNSIIFRRVQSPNNALISKVQQVLNSILSDPVMGQKSLQYGRTLGDEELQTQLAKILVSLGIKSAPENIAMFDNLSELLIVLGQIFINPSDKVPYLDEEGEGGLAALKGFYGADLKPLTFLILTMLMEDLKA